MLGRDIKKTIIIDNLKENFWSTCPNNGIEILSWYGEDLEDRELFKLIPFLKGIVENEEKDVRKVITKYRNNFDEYTKDFCNPKYIGKKQIRRADSKTYAKEATIESDHVPSLRQAQSDPIEDDELARAEYLRNQKQKRIELNGV